METIPVIEVRPDERGIPVYVVVHNGRDLTSRWTRTDAEAELQRLTTLPAAPADMQLVRN